MFRNMVDTIPLGTQMQEHKTITEQLLGELDRCSTEYMYYDDSRELEVNKLWSMLYCRSYIYDCCKNY